jgi:hypothetical protein
MNYVANLLEMPPMRVYEVATFYTMFNRYIGTQPSWKKTNLCVSVIEGNQLVPISSRFVQRHLACYVALQIFSMLPAIILAELNRDRQRKTESLLLSRWNVKELVVTHR